MIAAQDSGYEVHVALTPSDGAVLVDLRSYGVHIHELELDRSSVNPFRELKALVSIMRLIRRVGPDLVHSITIKPNIYVGVVAFFLRLPLVVSFPGLGKVFLRDTRYFRILQGWLLWFFRRIFDRRSCVVLTENGEDSEILKSRGCYHKGLIKSVPGAGIDLEVFRMKGRKGRGSGPLQILFAGRLYRNKGLDFLVDAVNTLQSFGESVSLVVAGVIDEHSAGAYKLSEIIELERQGLIDWRGAVENMPELISSVDVVCVPSLTREGLPRVLLEGMACGKPVITTNVAGCREPFIRTSEEFGFIVEPGDVEGLMGKLKFLIDSPYERGRLGTSGRRLIEEIYADNYVISEMEQAYERVMSGN